LSAENRILKAMIAKFVNGRQETGNIYLLAMPTRQTAQLYKAHSLQGNAWKGTTKQKMAMESWQHASCLLQRQGHVSQCRVNFAHNKNLEQCGQWGNKIVFQRLCLFGGTKTSKIISGLLPSLNKKLCGGDYNL